MALCIKANNIGTRFEQYCRCSRTLRRTFANTTAHKHNTHIHRHGEDDDDTQLKSHWRDEESDKNDRIDNTLLLHTYKVRLR